jgi:hypothetical protein
VTTAAVFRFAYIATPSVNPNFVHRMGPSPDSSASKLPTAADLGISEATDEQRILPPAALVLIDEGPDGHLLIRYAISGEFAGDTWHPDLENAMHQAEREFGQLTWKVLPRESSRPDEFAKARLAERSEYTQRP